MMVLTGTAVENGSILRLSSRTFEAPEPIRIP
jgi:hypothetical protein